MPAAQHTAASGVALRRTGALLMGAGALGLAATCVFYALAGPAAALPGGAASAAEAMAATPAATRWMRAAGLVGMPSDVLLAVGALLFGAVEHRRGAALALAGWLAMALSGALFIAVDAMVAMVLPAVARAGAEAAYTGMRSLFDVLFTMGAWTAGGGALAAAWVNDSPLLRWPAVTWTLRAAGVVGLAASAAHLAGLPGAAFIGPGIALLAVAALGTVASATRDAPAPPRLGGSAAMR